MTVFSIHCQNTPPWNVKSEPTLSKSWKLLPNQSPNVENRSPFSFVDEMASQTSGVRK